MSLFVNLYEWHFPAKAAPKRSNLNVRQWLTAGGTPSAPACSFAQAAGAPSGASGLGSGTTRTARSRPPPGCVTTNTGVLGCPLPPVPADGGGCPTAHAAGTWSFNGWVGRQSRLPVNQLRALENCIRASGLLTSGRELGCRWVHLLWHNSVA